MKLRELAAAESGRVVQRLAGSGFDDDDARSVQAMFRGAAQRLARFNPASTPDDAAKAFWVPGRIEVLGPVSLLAASTAGCIS